MSDVVELLQLTARSYITMKLGHYMVGIFLSNALAASVFASTSSLRWLWLGPYCSIGIQRVVRQRWCRVLGQRVSCIWHGGYSSSDRLRGSMARLLGYMAVSIHV